MVCLIAPNGATVRVSGEKAERLLSQGFRPVAEPVVKPTRRTRVASPKTDDE